MSYDLNIEFQGLFLVHDMYNIIIHKITQFTNMHGQSYRFAPVNLMLNTCYKILKLIQHWCL